MQRINCRKLSLGAWFALALAAAPGRADQAQLSLSAYRALGQLDLRQNGVNMVGITTLANPKGVAVDAAGHVYVADTQNQRVLAWTSSTAFQNGAAAALVLGQPSPQYSAQYGIGVKGFSFPWSVAADPVTGNLYVSDSGNNRILRFPKPFANPTRIEPDAVYGQPDFATRFPNSSGVTASTMNSPRGIGFDSLGNLWVADTGNHRLLRFPAAVLNAASPAADLVLGQPDFHSASSDRGGAVSASGFDSPFALVFDAQNNLYVADYQNTRVLKFPAPVTAAAVAAVVYGEANFASRGVPILATSSSMAGPASLAVDKSGKLYVAVPNDNRVLIFAPGASSGAAAVSALGQPDLTTVTPDTGTFPQASASSLFNVNGIALDPRGDLLAADGGNNRVLIFTAGAQPASLVLGQTSFSANGPNQIKPGSINAPAKIAVDYSSSPFPIYVSDANNNRVLVWKDSAHFHTGDPADLVIGQPSFSTGAPNADSGGGRTPSATGLLVPRGIAVAANGALYVADSGNNRVLRYPRPVDQTGRITPDAVFGQADFTSSNSAAVNASSLKMPAAVAIGPNGNVFIADSGNNRVLEFPAGSGTGANAVRVYGQPTFTTATAPTTASALTLASPQALFVDQAYNLFVADTGANRVLVFPSTKSAPATGLAASIVIGQNGFDGVSSGGGATGFRGPLDIAQDSQGNIFVSDNGNNRVMVFPSLLFLPTSGGTAYLAVGQPNLGSGAPNWNTPDGLATPEGLIAPVGIFVDRRDTLYVGDSGNNRVVHFLKPVAVVNGADFEPTVPVGRGAWCTLGGSGLSTQTQLAATAALPTALAGRELVVNDQMKAPLLYFSPTQVNFVLPSSAPVGAQRIAARLADTGELVAGGSITVAAYSPGFFTHDQSGSGQAAARNQDNSINGPSNPAALGSIVQLFGTGAGAVVSPVADGQPAPLTTDNTVAAPTSDANTCLNHQPAVCVALGGSGVGSQLAEIQYSGLAPGLVGVWQVNIKLPTEGVLGNAFSVRALIGGANQSNLVTIAVK